MKNLILIILLTFIPILIHSQEIYNSIKIVNNYDYTVSTIYKQIIITEKLPNIIISEDGNIIKTYYCQEEIGKKDSLINEKPNNVYEYERSYPVIEPLDYIYQKSILNFSSRISNEIDLSDKEITQKLKLLIYSRKIRIPILRIKTTIWKKEGIIYLTKKTITIEDPDEYKIIYKQD